MHLICAAVCIALLVGARAKNPLFPRCPLFDKCAVVTIEGTILCDQQPSGIGPQYVELWEDDNSFDDLVRRVQVNSNGTFRLEGRAQEFFTEGLGLFLKVFSTCGIKPRVYNSFDDLVRRVQVNSNGTFRLEGRAQEFFTEGLGLFLKVFSTCGIKPRFYGKCWHMKEISVPNKYWTRLVYNDWDVIWKPANINFNSIFDEKPFCKSD
uniref:Transthyretin/hydroxyisourate hydrolase domain-containing protein n=1 Tax=Ascaris lumbricoides TaxID=6252 RepID=A0A0M3IU19_ASCLU